VSVINQLQSYHYYHHTSVILSEVRRWCTLLW